MTIGGAPVPPVPVLPEAPLVPPEAELPFISSGSPCVLVPPTPQPLAAAAIAIGMMKREGIQARNMRHLDVCAFRARATHSV